MAKILEVRRLTKRFGGLVAVNQVSFALNHGEILGLLGPNGAGKTTLFHLIAGHLACDEGEIWFQGQRIEHIRPPHRRCLLGIARTFQESKPFRQMTVLENAMVGAFSRTASRMEARRIAWEALEATSLVDKAFFTADNLTIVDRKRLEVARALSTQPRLLLLDEVMAGLTPAELQDVLALLRSLRERGITLLVIEHIMQAVMTISDRVLVLNYGTKIAEGPPQQVSQDSLVIEAYLGEASYLAGE